ncbi:MAG: hypothetical protein MJ105_09830 [Lachnospiraceae bacterium]|nr:hypothetical protein [Lachnospiraceae bacterium]
MTPETRYGLNELIENSVVKYYNPERLIRFNKGRTQVDDYWVKCDDL